MNEKPVKFNIAFLPWLDLEEELDLGEVKIWPFYKYFDKKIPDADIKSHLYSFFNGYINTFNNDIAKSICICQFNEEFCFNNITEEIFSFIKDVVNIMVFLVIAPGIKRYISDSQTIQLYSSERFELSSWQINLKTKGLVLKTDYQIIGGLELGKFKFRKPIEVNGGQIKFDSFQNNTFKNCFRNQTFNKSIRKIIRALDWFRLAHYDSTKVSDLTKIVLLATAFETLLNLPNNNKTGTFSNIIANIFNEFDLIETVRQVGRKKKQIKLNLAGSWANDFYNLRSRIVHGDIINENELIHANIFKHFHVATFILKEAIDKIFLENKLISQDQYSIQKKLFERQSEVLTRLGWKKNEKGP